MLRSLIRHAMKCVSAVSSPSYLLAVCMRAAVMITPPSAIGCTTYAAWLSSGKGYQLGVGGQRGFANKNVQTYAGDKATKNFLLLVDMQCNLKNSLDLQHICPRHRVEIRMAPHQKIIMAGILVRTSASRGRTSCGEVQAVVGISWRAHSPRNKLSTGADRRDHRLQSRLAS